MGQTQISLATIGGAPFLPPVQVVGSGTVTMVAASSPSPAPLVLQIPAGRAAELVSVACDNTANVTIQVYCDDQPQINQTVAQLETFPTVNTFNAKAFHNLQLNFINTGSSTVTNFRYWFVLRLWSPSVLEKILNGIALNATEQQIAADPYGLAPTYAKEGIGAPPTLYDLIAQGQQPLSWTDLTDIDYLAKPTLTASVALNNQSQNVAVTFQDLVPHGDGQFIVLESIESDPDTAADSVQVVLAVDGQEQYLTVPTYPLDSSDVPLWVAAEKEIRLDLQASGGVPASALNTRVNYSIRRASPLLLARWGTASQADLATMFAGMNTSDPANDALQLWNQVRAGLK